MAAKHSSSASRPRQGLSRLMVTVVLCVVAPGALAVTLPPVRGQGDGLSSLTTEAAARAHVDVQIRRLKALMANQSGQDSERIFERLQRLHQQSRGPR